ncbi:hypothetical protein [Tepidanaerobacter syntrophicus]|uniref:hypothetical protein n=1 Tax=Tepidanaerobacter syntrophicus TaxID=224999 RepID=UPI001BD31B67|nr:hypothetical protein [Tepidanaerobacter syntrophicus]
MKIKVHTLKIDTNKILKQINRALKSKAIDLIYIVVIVTTLMIVDTLIFKRQFNFSKYFQITIATSISLTYFLSLIVDLVSNKIEQKIEDSLKLNYDFAELEKMYSGDKERFVTNTIINKRKSDLDKESFPVILEYFNLGNMRLSIIDEPNKHYQLPEFVEDNFRELFNSHKHSNIFNSLHIRLDNVVVKDNNVTMYTSRTTYYNSLVTNRAMDKEIEKNLTVRSMYEFDNRISKLEISKLSNHIGINGIVETKDKKFIFASRFGNVSIGKNTLGCSVGASLKAKYALNKDGRFDLNGLENGIINEIKDELFILKTSGAKRNYDFSISKNIVAIYRDLLEGGKPQLLFYIRCGLNSFDIKRLFESKKDSKSKEQKKLIRDGFELLFLDPDRIILEKDELVYEKQNGIKKRYKILPSVSASIVLVLRYKKYIEEKNNLQSM